VAACFLLTGKIRSLPAVVATFHAAHLSVDGLYALPVGKHGGPDLTQYLLVSASHDPAFDGARFSFAKAKTLRKLAKRAGCLEIAIDFLEGSSSAIPDHLPENILQDPREQNVSDGEIMLGRMTQRRFPSEVCLVKSADGRVMVRKTFSAGLFHNMDRELRARQLVADARLSPILATQGMSIYLPWYSQHFAFSGGLFRFYPIQAARNVINFLEALNARGFAMLDINPGSFLFDSQGNVIVVDCEYLTAAPAAPSFTQSLDYSGVAAPSDLPRPRATGWNHFWRDAVGAPYRVVRSGSRAELVAWRTAHVLLRVAKSPIAVLGRIRQTALATIFYWTRRHGWGIRVHGRSSMTGSSSLRTAATRQFSPESRRTTHANS
jgi:hypothetical protein